MIMVLLYFKGNQLQTHINKFCNNLFWQLVKNKDTLYSTSYHRQSWVMLTTEHMTTEQLTHNFQMHPFIVLIIFNPFTDKQLNLFGTVPKQVCYFSSLSIFCFECKNDLRASCSPAVWNVNEWRMNRLFVRERVKIMPHFYNFLRVGILDEIRCSNY